MTLLGLRVLPSRPSPCWRGSATSATRGRGLGGRCRHPRSATSPCMCVDHVLSNRSAAHSHRACFVSLVSSRVGHYLPMSITSACPWQRRPFCMLTPGHAGDYPVPAPAAGADPAARSPCHRHADLRNRGAGRTHHHSQPRVTGHYCGRGTRGLLLYFPDTRTTTAPFPLPSPLT